MDASLLLDWAALLYIALALPFSHPRAPPARCVRSFPPRSPRIRDRLQALTSSVIRSLLVVAGFCLFPVLLDDLSPLLFMKVRPCPSSCACIHTCD